MSHEPVGQQPLGSATASRSALSVLRAEPRRGRGDRSPSGRVPQISRPESARAARPVEGPDLVVVSNRLPIRFVEGSEQWVPAPGGLVSAMRPVLARHNGTWVGWNPGRRPLPRVGSMILKGVALPPAIANGYYAGYANRVVWPALHGLRDRVEHDAGWWDAYTAANELFAAEVARVASPGANVWVHDYHLLLLPALLAARRPDLGVGLFLHTPVADPQVIAGLEHGDQLLAGMAGASLVGTQRTSDADHLRVQLAAWGNRHHTVVVTQVRAHRISIDVDRVVGLVGDPVVNDEAAAVKTQLGAGRRIVLSVDRLDYTKGILERLAAFEKLLDLGLVSAEEVVLIQIAVPSRVEVPAYRDLAVRVKARVRQINMRHASRHGQAVELICEDLPFRDVVAHYLAADIAMVTPLRDGMNLVAKEFVTARSGDPVCLVLGAGAGAADEFGAHAVLVDATDPLDLTAGLHEALQLSATDRVARSTALGRIVAEHDVYAWADEFLADLQATSHPDRTRATA